MIRLSHLLVAIGLTLASVPLHAQKEETYVTSSGARVTVWTPSEPTGPEYDIERQIRESRELLVQMRKDLHPEDTRILNALATLARLHAGAGHYTAARQLLDEAIEIAVRSRGADYDDTLFLQADLGELLIEQGQYAQAEELLDDVLATQDRIYSEPDTIYFPGSLGTRALLARIYLARGAYGRAEPIIQGLVEETDRFDSSIWDDGRAASAQLLLANTYRDVGRYDLSGPIYEEIYDRADRGEEIDELDALQARINMAADAQRIGDEEYAEYHLTEALQTTEELFGPDHTNTLVTQGGLADFLLAQGSLDEAGTLAEGIVERGTASLGSTNAVVIAGRERLAEIRLAQERYDEAGDLFMAALAAEAELFGRASIPVASSYRGLGDVTARQGDDPAKATWFYKQAVNTLQATRSDMRSLPVETQRSFVSKWEGTYLALQQLLIEQGRLAEAESVGRMVKNAEYYALVRGAEETATEAQMGLTPQETEWQEQFAAWLDRPVKLAQEIDALNAKRSSGAELSEREQRQLADLEGAYEDAYSEFRNTVDAWLGEVRELADEQVQEEARSLELASVERMQGVVASIGDDVALVQIVAFDDASHIFLTTPNAFKHVSVPIGRAELFSAIVEARAELIAPEHDIAIVKQRFGRLYDLLIKPIEPDLADGGTQTLMLNLQGALRYIPFAALWDGRGWLAERYQLALFTPAAQTRFAEPSSMSEGQGFGLSQAVQGYSALPGVRDELAGILSDGPGGTAPLRGGYLLDGQFTRASLEAGLAQARPVLHIASHFIMKPAQQGDSFLLLGDGTRLTLEEISRSSRLRFQGVELLTISACETALGGEGTGLEVEGFGALAQNKGAGAVIASLWSISDDATSEFMRLFYARVARDGLSKAEAMRATQREMMASERFADPWFWAPFILMGNWK